MAGQIAAQVGGDLLVIGLLKGSFVFLADLVRALDSAGLTPQIDFIRASSYGDSKQSSGIVKLSCEPGIDIRGRQILLVDDIVDSGRSLMRTRELLLERGAAKVMTCALLDKPARRAVDCAADFVGFSIEDAFVVGYGIDHAENYRHLPFIGVIE
jgi:hypoxanthine phosphoribosyltransferase